MLFSETLNEIPGVVIRQAVMADLDALVQLEQSSFSGDQLSRRSFRQWLKKGQSVLLVAEASDEVVGDNVVATKKQNSTQSLLAYGVVLFPQGTRLARLYSIAVSDAARGKGLGQHLLLHLERQAAKQGRLFMRLEVAEHNKPAIKLYEKIGYRIFGEYSDYYEDHTDALRMQKCIRQIAPTAILNNIPWYCQTTDFTCGPASLMMAMASQDNRVLLTQSLELDLWREATTIFMTSGHGGCHPLGLALAAKRRHFEVEVFLNNKKPLFLEGVRSDTKKDIMRLVDEQFRERSVEVGLPVINNELTQQQIELWLQQGWAVLILISTYRLDGRKVPHWVTVTAIDDDCLYVHDPDLDDEQQALDCQHIPIARQDFAKMSVFGSERLRTAIALRRVD